MTTFSSEAVADLERRLSEAEIQRSIAFAAADRAERELARVLKFVDEARFAPEFTRANAYNFFISIANQAKRMRQAALSNDLEEEPTPQRLSILLKMAEGIEIKTWLRIDSRDGTIAFHPSMLRNVHTGESLAALKELGERIKEGEKGGS